MDLGSILLIAIALSMDAFAVSMTNGITIKNLKPIHVLIIGVSFGFFQFFMPVLGYFGAQNFSMYIMAFDHWIVFILLALIGGKMIYETFKEEESDEPLNSENVLKFKNILVLAVATSIDAMAVGISFAFLKTSIMTPAIIIGITTFIISSIGVVLGNKLGGIFKKSAERVGGVILIGIGLKILLEHVFLA